MSEPLDPTQTQEVEDIAMTQSVKPDSTSTVVQHSQTSYIAQVVSPNRYTLGEEIARGGMGVVYQAKDNAFGREVAIKVLQDKFNPTSAAARRFADEARITGQLQHPAIPPVHDLGTLPDGRPFLAMKLIKGETLETLLKGRLELGDDRGRFISAFEALCQAVAYAHAHKVIHRDLKPANVMVGSFGEVQVMDWGLAKVLGTQTPDSVGPTETAAMTEIQSLRESDGSETQAGSILGTPAYMPPEQAVGAIGKIDERSDVFGLGAILAVILTGKPPFAANSAETTRIQAAQGNVADCYARLDNCEAESGLILLCKRCLSPKIDDRPAQAKEVAKAVAALRAEADERARLSELNRVQAEAELAASSLKAFERRKVRRIVSMAALVLVGVLIAGIIGTSIGLVRAATARDAESQARTAAEKAFDAEATEREKAEKALEALKVAAAAEAKAKTEAFENYQLARESVVSVVWDIPEVLREAVFARSAEQKLVAILMESMQKQVSLTSSRGLPDRAMHKLLLKLGELYYLQGKYDQANKYYDQALSVCERLLKEESFDKSRTMLNQASCYRSLGFLARYGRNDLTLALKHFRNAEKLQRDVMALPETSEDTSTDTRYSLALSLYEISDIYESQQNFADSLNIITESVKVLEEANRLKSTQNSRNSRNTSMALADAYIKLGDLTKNPEQAEKVRKDAVAIYERELKLNPDSLIIRKKAAEAVRATGDSLLFLKKYDEAKQYHIRDMELSKGLLQINEIMNAQASLSRAYYRSATLALRQNDRKSALNLYRECAEIRRHVVEGQPANDFGKMSYSLALARSGDHVAAATIMADMASRFPTSVSVVEKSAAIYGLCADAILNGRKETDLNTEEMGLRKKYFDEAFTNLDRLVSEWEWKNLASLELDPDLDPLRNDSRFSKVVQKVKNRIAGKPAHNLPYNPDDAHIKQTMKDGFFVATFPSQPTTRKQKVGILEFIHVIAEHEKAAFTVTYSDLPNEAVNKNTPEKMLEGGETGLVSSMNLKVIKSSATILKCEGKDYPARDIMSKKDELQLRHRLILAGDRLFQVSIVGPRDVVVGKVADSFLNSFKITR